MYRPIEMEVKGDGTKFRVFYNSNRSDYDEVLETISFNLSLFWDGSSGFKERFLSFYADWYANPVTTITADSKEEPVLCHTSNLLEAYFRNEDRLKAVCKTLKNIEENGQNTSEVYDFGKQKQTNNRGSREDVSEFGARDSRTQGFDYPMAGYNQEAKPSTAGTSESSEATDKVTYGEQTDSVDVDAHTNTVTRKDNSVATLKALGGMDSFTKTVLDVFKDCFTLSEFGTW